MTARSIASALAQRLRIGGHLKRIHGYVLVRESNQGIPKLVVSAFDSETSIQDLLKERSRASLPPQLLERLGKRIGSVLTDKDGAFCLTRDDMHFEGVESRPDLVLVVLAPEDVLDPKGPFVLPPEQRVLYISAVPRADAGAEEAFIIRLQQAQLDAFRIPLSTTTLATQQRLAATSTLLHDIEQSSEIRDQLKTKLHPRLKEEHARNMALRDKARKAVSLSALPPSVREHPQLMKDPADLSKLQKEVVKAGLNQFKDEYKPNLRLTLRAAELRSLGMRVYKNGNAKGKINTQKLTEKLRELVGGVHLVRRDDIAPSAVSPEVLLARYANADDSSNKPGRPRKHSQSKKKTAAPRGRRT
jgi:hypothetical protein